MLSPGAGVLQVLRADLDRHAAGDLRHRGEQRQEAARDGRDAAQMGVPARGRGERILDVLSLVEDRVAELQLREELFVAAQERVARDDDVGVLRGGREGVAGGGDIAHHDLGVDEILGATEADKTDFHLILSG